MIFPKAPIRCSVCQSLSLIKVISGPHEVDGWYVCTKIDLDPASPASTQFTFGNPPKKLTDQQNKVKTQLAGTAVMVGGMMGYLNM